MSSPATATPSSALLAWLNCHGYESSPITERTLCDKAQELLDVANTIYDPLYDSRGEKTVKDTVPRHSPPTQSPDTVPRHSPSVAYANKGCCQ